MKVLSDDERCIIHQSTRCKQPFNQQKSHFIIHCYCVCDGKTENERRSHHAQLVEREREMREVSGFRMEALEGHRKGKTGRKDLLICRSNRTREQGRAYCDAIVMCCSLIPNSNSVSKSVPEAELCLQLQYTE